MIIDLVHGGTLNVPVTTENDAMNKRDLALSQKGLTFTDTYGKPVTVNINHIHNVRIDGSNGTHLSTSNVQAGRR